MYLNKEKFFKQNRAEMRGFLFAESMGFEPMRAFTPYLVSSEALSTTQPTLHIFTSFKWRSLRDSLASWFGALSALNAGSKERSFFLAQLSQLSLYPSLYDRISNILNIINI
jgi:hypothetical protein